MTWDREATAAGDAATEPTPSDHAPKTPRVSSAMRAIDLDQTPKPHLIGERVNAQGSRKVKRLLLADDYEGIVEVARDQAESGAHVLDVCVAVTERGDEAEQMATVVKLLSMSVEFRSAIDSTEAKVIERALEAIPGRAIINSINMENGRERIDKIVPLAKKHGAALVALTIDPIGMAKTRERKLEIARKIHDIVVGEYGMRSEDLIFDDLTFTLATWAMRSGSTPPLRRSMRHPAHQARAARCVHVPGRLEREFRAVARRAGRAELRVPAPLRERGAGHGDLSIPACASPVRGAFSEDRAIARRWTILVFNHRPDALQRFIEHFDAGSRSTRDTARGVKGRSDGRDDAGATRPLDDRAPEERRHRGGPRRGAGPRAPRSRAKDEVLLPAMKEVGDKFGAGELILPFVLAVGRSDEESG